MRSTVKKVLNRCVICKKVTGCLYLAPSAPALPEFRVNNLNAFESTAIDFTAHLYVKNGTLTQKVYVCLFTCCTTRAVHLEITPDLTCESFIRAFRRFSVPKIVCCDNDELRRMYINIASDECQSHFSNRGITLKYTPAQASRFGGVHKRLIGVCKSAIKKTLGKALITYDEMLTIVKQMQQIMNNRPLTYMSADPNELKPITPNHLIYGHELSMIPTEVIETDTFDPTFAGNSKLEQIVFNRSKLIEHFRSRFYDE